MSDQLFDKFADQEALEAQKQMVLKIFEEIKSGIRDLSAMGLKIDQSSSLSELNKNTKELADIRKKLDEANKQLATSEKTIADLQAKFTQQAKSNRDQLKGQTEEIKKQTEAIKSNTKSFDDLVKLSVILKETSRGITEERKRIRKEFEDGRLSNEEYIEGLAELTKLELQVKDNTGDVARALKNLTQEFNSAEGSTDQLRAKLNLMLQSIDALSDENDPGGELRKALQKDITAITAEITKAEQATGRFQRNVGNYANSLSGGFEQVRREITRIQAVQKDLSQRGDFRGAEAAGRQIEKLDDIMRVSFDTTKSYQQQVKSLGTSYVDLATSGEFSKEFLEEFKTFIAEAKNNAANLTKEIKAIGSETRTFDLLSGAISTAATAYEVYNATAALTGEQNEDVEKSIRKLVAIQSIANGAREIAKQLTEKETIAGKAYAFVQAQIAIVTNASATATARFGAALKLTGIGLLVTTVAYLITNFDKLFKTIDPVVDELDKLEGVTKESKDALKEYGDTAEKITEGVIKDLKDQVKGLNDELGRTPTAINNAETQIRALEQTQKKLAEQQEKVKRNVNIFDASSAAKYTKNAEALKSIDEQLKAVNLQLEITRQLQAEADRKEFGGAAAEAALQSFKDAQDLNNRQLSDAATSFAKRRDLLKNNLDLERLIVEKQYEIEQKEAGDNQAKLFAADSKHRSALLKADRDYTDNRLKLIREEHERESKARQEINEADLNQRIALNQQIIDEEKAPQTDRLVALYENAHLRQLIIEKQADDEKKKVGLTAREIAAIEEKKQLALTNLYLEFGKKREDIVGDFAEKEKAIFERLVSRFSNLSVTANVDIAGGTADANQRFIDEAKQKEEAIKSIKDAAKDLAQELTGLAIDVIFSDAGIDDQLAKLEEEIRLIELKRDKELNAVNQLAIAEDEKAKKIANINARAEQQMILAERKRRDLERQKAKLDRDRNIANIIQATALAVVNALQTQPAYLGIALAAIVAGLGAAQIARALATPLPAYKSGTKSAKKGPGVVAEEGYELVEKDGRMYVTPDRPTLMSFTGGEKVFPHDVSKQMIAAADRRRAAAFGSTLVKVDTSNKEIIEKQNEQISLLKKISNKPITHITIIENQSHHEYEIRNVKR